MNFLPPSQTYVQGSFTLPGRYFSSQEIFQLEQERIFSKSWLCVGHLSQLDQQGNFFLVNLPGESIIVLRDRQNQLRAFFNNCRHRGTRLCEVLSGRFSESIQCSYHAWTYALDGSLIGAPFTQEIQDFDRTEYSLIQVLVTTWEGFIFIHLPPQIQSFDLALGNIFDRFLRFNTAKLVPGGRITYDVKANWKLIFQNYSECLHCPTLHPDLARLSPFQSGANDLYEGYVLGGYMEISSPGGSMTMTGRACGLPVSDELKPEDGQRVYYYSIFPNMLLSLHPDYVMYHTILPQTPDRSAVTCEWLFHPKSFTQLDFNPADAVDFWDMTNRQDWHICEQSQLGVTSRAYQPGPYAPRESLLAAWDRAYLQALDAYA